jgi:hypothetical protein
MVKNTQETAMDSCIAIKKWAKTKKKNYTLLKTTHIGAKIIIFEDHDPDILRFIVYCRTCFRHECIGTGTCRTT